MLLIRVKLLQNCCNATCSHDLQALSDIQQVNKTDAATDDTRDMEKRLKEVLSGKRVGAANGPPSGISGRGLAAAVRSVVCCCFISNSLKSEK